MGPLGSGSDYASFFHYLGISAMDIAYTYNKSKTSARIYPAYHTAYDTFDYASRFIDPGFTSHQAVARTAGNVVIRLADASLLPFKARDYSEALAELYQQAEQHLGPTLAQQGIYLEHLQRAVIRFSGAAERFDLRMSENRQLLKCPLQQRMMNDQLMSLERSFLDPLAFPSKLYYRHVVYASRSSPVRTFPGLADAMEEAMASGNPSLWESVRRQLALLTYALESAASVLEPPLDGGL